MFKLLRTIETELSSIALWKENELQSGKKVWKDLNTSTDYI